MSHFVNDRARLVSDALDGAVLAAGGRLARLDERDARIVLRSTFDRAKVAIISGGGAGHEPAHVGFVGRGMLTAAVCGDVFASPGSEAVLAAILAVAGPAGVLLIVKNYTGDRLNFGLAAERARGLGHAVEMVIVADDVALPELAQPRGIAGTLFVHKVAGHAAERGDDLAAVAAAAAAAARATRSLGIALTGCTIPGRPAEARIADGQAEIGLGIHGEPGVERIALGRVDEVVEMMLARLLPDHAGDAPLALLVNNLGGVPALEMGVVGKAVLESAQARRVELLVGPMPLMTALDMKGFSLSVLPLDDERRAALLAPVEASAWPPAVRPATSERVAAVPPAAAIPPTPAAAMPPTLPRAAMPPTQPGTAADRAWVQAALRALIDAEDELNRLDATVGDGDTGTTIAGAARALAGELDWLVLASWGDTLSAMGRRIGEVSGGSSGVLVSILLAATGASLRAGAGWPAALGHGLERVSFYGGAVEGERTMIDAMAPAVAALDRGGGLPGLAEAATRGADGTAGVGATRSGRSSYLAADSLLGTPDPGAVAFARLCQALARAGAA